MKERFSKGFWYALCAIVLAACSTMTWHKPQVSLANVHVMGGNLLEKKLRLTLRVHNENDRDIVLDGLVFELAAGDFIIANGARNEPITLARMADTLVEIDATAQFLELLRRLPALVQSDGRVEYAVRGEAQIHGYGKVPFDHKDSLSVSQLLGSAAATPAPAPAASAPQ